MVVGRNDDDLDSSAANNPMAPGEPIRAAREPVTPVPGVHKETRDHRQGNPGSEGTGHTEGGGRDSQ